MPPVGVAAAPAIKVGCGDAGGLVAAVARVNTAHAGVVELTAGCDYVLRRPIETFALPPVVGEVTVRGNGATIRRDAGAEPFGIVAVEVRGQLVLNDVTIRGGLSELGAGIVNWGRLTLNRVTVTENEALLTGGGIENQSGANAWITGSTITRNTARRSGGGIHNRGALTLKDSRVSANLVDDCDPVDLCR